MLGTSRAIATMLASVLVVAPAFAQPKASEKDKARANELVKQAIAKSQAKQHLEAIDLYLEAYAVVPASVVDVAAGDAVDVMLIT